MTTSRRGAGLVALVASAALVLTACGGGGGAGGSGGQAGDVSGGAAQESNDINPVDRAQLRQGGDLLFPLSDIPPNFNYQHVDGTLADVRDVTDGIFPLIFKANAQGVYEPDPDYVVSAEVTGQNPQVITYTLNPNAVWSNGRKMDWTDFDAMWKALNGTNPDYSVSSSTGYDVISSVAQGATPEEVVVTFSSSFGDWRANFQPFYPKEITGTPESFNTGLTEEVSISGGPFQVESIDRTAKRMVSVPNPSWWGDKPMLDRILYTALDPNAMPEAYANGTLSFFEIGPSVSYFQRAQTVPNTIIRKSNGPNYRHMTFNGSPTSILNDPALRKAIMKGIDRNVITQSQIGPILPDAKPLGNHIYVDGIEGYTDNSGVVAYNPEQASQELDALGWVRQGDVRVKDGRELAIRDVIPSGVAVADGESKIAQQQLAAIGVKLNIDVAPVDAFFKEYVNTGNFDIVHFAYLGTPTPLSSSAGIYKSTPGQIGQNYGQIGSDRINELVDRANGEIDPAKQRELANELDRELWDIGHSLLLYQRPDAWAVKSDLANFGAKGFADYRYQDFGFVQQ